MSDQNERHRAEMEVKPILQIAIVAHHIIIVVCAVVISIFHIVILPRSSFLLILWILILYNIPTVAYVTLWIASKCRYQDLRLILVHFNPCLSTLWFLVYSPWFFITLYYIDETEITVQVIIHGVMSLSSAIFATYGIWKIARNVILSSRGVKHEHYDVLASLPSTVDSPDNYVDCNVQRLSEAYYVHPI
ncbi:hypothetical protein ACJMK2_029625 [Sinanodonta woodiana]|uniref:Uncharacterized protein n=1 Tax=Sinanodonta woodiana TaxID=1069815 RepID=A0ABD3XCN3_SINWO